jgi:Domain of unknown function (DUF4185)
MNATAPKIHSCRYLGNLPALKTGAYVVVGQDGGQSVRMNGKTLFFFSDTLLVCKDLDVAAAHATVPPVPVPSLPQTVFLANCAAVSEGQDLATILSNFHYFHAPDGLPREILKPTDRERFRNLRFWPEHGICFGGKIYFFYLGIQTIDPSSNWGFRNLGVGLAALDPESGECYRFEYRGDWIFWRPIEADLHIGVQVIPLGEFVYVFGSRRIHTEHTALLARVPAECMTDRDAYEYLASPEPSWSKDFRAACTLGPSASEYSVSYNRYLEKYTMIYIDEHRKRLMLRTADRPWGPYTPPTDLIGVPHKDSSAFVYLGFEHAGFQQQDGRKIFVSYCEPDFSPGSLVTLIFDRGAPATIGAEVQDG